MIRTLDVTLLDNKAGCLTQDETGALQFTYATDYLAMPIARAISVSMPLREAPYGNAIASPYFSGLLPDEQARRRLAAVLGLSQGNAFGLLEVIGGECAGALSLRPAGELAPEPQPDDLEQLDETRLQQLLELLRTRPLLGGEEGVRLSLAGAQDKLAVSLIDDRIALAKGGLPTTHILKPAIEGLDGSVENELFCMRLASRLGLPVPHVSAGRAGPIQFLLVQRYDRIIDAKGNVRRIHQEDFCQALSVPPELKYEEEGGPGIATCVSLIQGHTAMPAGDRLTFLSMLIFHYLVGNADAHGKNYALLYHAKAPDLAPLYDVVSTAVYPRLSKRLAMTIGGRNVADTIGLKHWLGIVPATKPAERLLKRDLRDLAGRIEDEAVALIDELTSEGITHDILKAILKTIRTRVTHILTMTKSA